MKTPATVTPINATPKLTEEDILQRRMDAKTPAEKAKWSAELQKFDAGYIARAIHEAEEKLLGTIRDVFVAQSEDVVTLLTAATSRQFAEPVGEAGNWRYFVQFSRVQIPQQQVKPGTTKPAAVGAGVTPVPPGTPDDNIPAKK